jgi:hypothetical protein
MYINHKSTSLYCTIFYYFIVNYNNQYLDYHDNSIQNIIMSITYSYMDDDDDDFRFRILHIHFRFRYDFRYDCYSYCCHQFFDNVHDVHHYKNNFLTQLQKHAIVHQQNKNMITTPNVDINVDINC